MKKKSIWAIIPARGGSKSIPKKNIMNIKGYPLIAYSIAAAKLSKKIDRIIVTTDSEEMAEVAKKYGAEAPFIRPAKIAQDRSTDKEFFDHAIAWFKKHEKKVPDYFVHLRPTTPLRDPKNIAAAIEHMLSHPQANAMRSGHKIEIVPQKFFGLDGEYFVGLFPDDKRPDYHNMPRQSFAPTYKPDGYVDMLRPSFITKSGRIHGNRLLAFLTPETVDIDYVSDLMAVKENIGKQRWAVYDYLKKRFKPTPLKERLAH